MKKLIWFVLISLLLLSLGFTATAGGNLVLDWWTVDGGGGVSSGGDYTMAGTIGQADAGMLGGGNYALQGGFWGFASTGGTIYLPMIHRGP